MYRDFILLSLYYMIIWISLVFLHFLNSRALLLTQPSAQCFCVHHCVVIITHTPGQCYHIAHVLRPVTQHNFHTHATSHVCIIGFFRFHITCTRIGSIHHDTWVHVHVFTQSPSHNDTIIDILCAFTTHLLRFHN